MNTLVPMVVEHLARGERLIHLSRLFEGTHHLRDRSDRGHGSKLNPRALLFFGSGKSKERDRDVHQFAGRTGDVGVSRFTTTMQYIFRPSVQTLCVGQAASAASLLLCAGAKGSVYSLPNARILVHTPRPYHGRRPKSRACPRDRELKRRLPNLRQTHGQALEAVEKRIWNRDTYMTPERPSFGILDEVTPGGRARMGRKEVKTPERELCQGKAVFLLKCAALKQF